MKYQNISITDTETGKTEVSKAYLLENPGDFEKLLKMKTYSHYRIKVLNSFNHWVWITKPYRKNQYSIHVSHSKNLAFVYTQHSSVKKAAEKLLNLPSIKDVEIVTETKTRR